MRVVGFSAQVRDARSFQPKHWRWAKACYNWIPLIAPTMNKAFLRQELHHSTHSSCAVFFVAQSTTQVNDPSVLRKCKDSWKALQFFCESAAKKLHVVFIFCCTMRYLNSTSQPIDIPLLQQTDAKDSGNPSQFWKKWHRCKTMGAQENRQQWNTTEYA